MNRTPLTVFAVVTSLSRLQLVIGSSGSHFKKGVQLELPSNQKKFLLSSAQTVSNNQCSNGFAEKVELTCRWDRLDFSLEFLDDYALSDKMDAISREIARKSI